MTSKTFESIDQTRQLHVKPLDKHVTLVINYKDAGRSGLTISHSDAPALALAVLEAAGYEERQKGWDVLNSADENIAQAMRCLSKGIEIQERATAEAKELAELEAEALELFKASGTYGSDRISLKLSDLDDHIQEAWLAVARRAREMRAEK